MGVKKIVYVDYENMGVLKVEWVAIEGTGKNALDFHIAYFMREKI